MKSVRALSPRLGAVVCLGLVLSVATIDASEAFECTARPGRIAQLISGDVAGDRNFSVEIGEGRSFQLIRSEFGWTLSILGPNSIDLTSVTPPFSGAPNAREIEGWHFRNKRNTGPNKGSVNAPQRTRIFHFDPRLSETGGFKPSDGNFSIEDIPGRGLLKIEEIGLADLEKDQKARLVYMEFNACITWPESEEELDVVSYTDETVERFAACGLPLSHQLSAFLRPRTLSGDFDGDGIEDIAGPIVNMQTGKRAIAVCRANSQLDLLGEKEPMGEVVPAYFDNIDHWSKFSRGPVPKGASEATVPVLTGDALLIGKQDASSALIYRDGASWSSYWQGD